MPSVGDARPGAPCLFFEEPSRRLAFCAVRGDTFGPRVSRPYRRPLRAELSADCRNHDRAHRQRCRKSQRNPATDAEDLHEQGLRVRVLGGGCSGFTYDLFFEDETTDLDHTFESHGIPLYIDMMSFQYLEGTQIDYVEGLYGAGFKFINPQATATAVAAPASRPDRG